MKEKFLIQKAHTLMEEKKWEEALVILESIRKEKPDEPVGFITAGVALRNLKRYDEAAFLLIDYFDHSRAKPIELLFDLIEKVTSKDLLESIWKILISEKFNFEVPTVISLKMPHLYYTNKVFFDKYYEYLKGIDELDYYTTVSLGFTNEPEIEYLQKIFETNNIQIISRVASSAPLHRYNLQTVLNNNLYTFSTDIFIHRLYKSLNNFLPVKNADFVSNKKLKIAICVSGQLRGYQKAFKTWDSFHRGNHQIDYYCSVWDNIGQKKIVLNTVQLRRLFRKNFVNIFDEYRIGQSIEQLKKALPSLFTRFDKKRVVTKEAVQSFYSAKKVAVEEEDKFSDKSNMYKMHYMIEKCYDLIDNPDEYDLIVRIRPDKELICFDIDWNHIYDYLHDAMLLSDAKPTVHQGAGFVMGDQFAVSTPTSMQEYSLTFSKVKNNTSPYNEKFYGGYRAHMTLFLSLLQKNIDVYDFSAFKGKVKFGQPLDLDAISKEELMAIVQKDLKDDKIYKKKFMEAINEDYSYEKEEK